MAIIISKTDCIRCLQFAQNFFENEKSELDFGNKDIPRALTDKIADCTAGKIGEIAFKKLCESRGLKIDIDFNIHKGIGNIDDGQDVLTIYNSTHSFSPKLKTDVKTSKKASRWLLIDKTKFVSNIYIFIKAELPPNIEKDLSAFNSDINCEFAGYAFKKDFFDENDAPWFEYKEGDLLLDTRIIRCAYDKAKQKYRKITAVAHLNEFYADCKKIFVEQFNPNSSAKKGIKLKSPRQFGMPIDFIRKNSDMLIDVIRQDTIPEKLLGTHELIKLNGDA